MSLSEAAVPMDASLVGADVTFRGCRTDSRTIREGELFIALRGERFDGHDFLDDARRAGAGAALVEKRPVSASLPILVVKDARHAMGQLAAHWRGRFELPVIAVTGSNGKTTVKEMLASILSVHAEGIATRGNLNNDIGVPLTLFELGAEHRYAIIEMGANHRGEIAWLSRIASPGVAVITQCAPAHLEGFGAVEDVARAKAEIYGGLPPDGTAIINADDTFAPLWRRLAGGHAQVSFGIRAEADVTASNIEMHAAEGHTAFVLDTPRGRVDIELHLRGVHNVANALAAAACSEAAGIPLHQVRTGLGRMQGVKGRLQVKPGTNGSRILDDTYNANPVSLQAGLDVLSQFPGRRWLILGDMGELGPAAASLHRGAGEAARESGVERLFAIGTLSASAVEAFGAGAELYPSIAQLIDAVQSALAPDVTALIKGSRAMGMERVSNAVSRGN